MILDMEILPIWSSDGARGIKVVVKTDNGVFSSTVPDMKIQEKWEPPMIDNRRAVKKFQDIKKEFINTDERDFDILDDKIEKLGFKNIGSNLGIAISKALIKAGGKGDAYHLMNPESKKFPIIMTPIMCGGINGGYCSMQRFFAIPRGARTPNEAYNINIAFWTQIGKLLKSRGMILGMNEEGSWISQLTDIKTIEFLTHHAEKNNIGIGLDLSASFFYRGGYYHYPKIGSKFNSGEQLEFIRELVQKYRISYIEDPFHPNDFRAFTELTKRMKGTLISGDDLFSSQPLRLKKGIKEKAGNAFVLKLTRAGTISRALRLIDTAKEGNFLPVLADRTIETTDNFLADFAVASEVPLFKCGVTGGERVTKINRFMEIWFDISAQKEPQMNVLRI